MEPALGLRVVRGPDWEWGDQDGGEGFVGTVAEITEGGRAVTVQWDMGQRCRYRCGFDSKFDIRVLDNAQISMLTYLVLVALLYIHVCLHIGQALSTSLRSVLPVGEMSVGFDGSASTVSSMAVCAIAATCLASTALSTPS